MCAYGYVQVPNYAVHAVHSLLHAVALSGIPHLDAWLLVSTAIKGSEVSK